jgi:hypothetical protein
MVPFSPTLAPLLQNSRRVFAEFVHIQQTRVANATDAVGGHRTVAGIAGALVGIRLVAVTIFSENPSRSPRICEQCHDVRRRSEISAGALPFCGSSPSDVLQGRPFIHSFSIIFDVFFVK